MILPACTATPIQHVQPTKPASPIPLPNQSHSTFSPTNPNKNQSLSLKHNTKYIDPTIAWTSSIAQHCRSGRSGHLVEAASEFVRMREAGVEPNHITLITLLSACAHCRSPISISFGAAIHAHARKLGLDMNDVMLGTALIDMYAKCGRVDSARLVFDQMGFRNLVSWNTMIDGYMKNGEIEDALHLFDELPVKNVISWTALIDGFVKKDCHEEALDCFREMQLAGVAPDYVTVIAVLAACANLGALGHGLWVHRLVMTKDFRDNDRVSNTLIDMYSRCGCIELARQVFDRMPRRTMVSWNSIILGFAVNGQADEAVSFFNSMKKEGFEPNSVSYTVALSACSHAGLIDEGLRIFYNMKRVSRIAPRIEHYGCLVDLYSRAGRLEEALHVIKNMPMKPNEVVLGSLLAACRTQGDVELAENVMKYLVELDPEGHFNYVLLSNTYVAVGNWDGASKVRRAMKDRGIHKNPGFSSIEIDSSIHKFVAGDKSHEENDYIYAALDFLSFDLQLCGYVPDFSGKESYEDD
ncbi:pentatricopeptide repeat-containing protein At1g05750, chloroplastic-like [Gastrolobium bilobum]|uniref:pentatricopeptide repeat-containing protein At1g05750, chloroplastic-like n=1 Tax=Gastrolobium bilobum TaxID=150636 RepID=UPI002AAF3439|nr:pentatricopeptide repeat-containing protein At1g05750, chloroplastic-like [Gastrolobium bilobum]